MLSDDGDSHPSSVFTESIAMMYTFTMIPADMDFRVNLQSVGMLGEVYEHVKPRQEIGKHGA